jgi:xanthine dehydrogenase accessory factor
VELPGLTVLVRGVGDIGSAVAQCLFGEGCAVIMHDDDKPATTRRGMAFADAAFEGHAVLEGVRAERAADLEHVKKALARRDAIPLYVREWGPLLAVFRPSVLVDARMRKHFVPEVQPGYAGLTISLGPDLDAGRHADVVVETSWERLGEVITNGRSLALAGEPREIDGHARDRYVYAEAEGIFRTAARIGDTVRRGQVLALIGGVVVVPAPLDGVLRGLTHDGAPVKVGTKVVEVDPRGSGGQVRGIA